MGLLPTVNVPSVLPSKARSLLTVLSGPFGTRDVCTVKRHPGQSPPPYAEVPQVLTVARTQLSDRACLQVGHPDVGTIEGDAVGFNPGSDLKCP